MDLTGRSRFWTIAYICMASSAWAFEFGLGAPLASLWLKDAGCSDTIIGLNTSLYYLGIVLTASLVPWMMRRWGNGCPIAGMVASGVTLVAFPWMTSLTGLLVLRFLNGVASAMSLIPTETLVNRCSPPEQRSRNFGFYALAIAVGWALGTFVGFQIYADTPRLAFVFGGIISVIAGLIFHLGVPQLPEPETEGDLGARLPLRRTFLSFGTVWAQGFLEGVMVCHLPVYLRDWLGQTADQISWLTGGIMIGVILFQVPVAWFADRLGRTTILLACYGVVMAGLVLLPFCHPGIWLALWLFLVGACSGAFYPLGLSLLGEKLPESALARANAWYLAINCVGSMSGPAVTGLAIDIFGRAALFLTGEVAVLVILALWLALHVSARNAPPRQTVPDSNTRQAA